MAMTAEGSEKEPMESIDEARIESESTDETMTATQLENAEQPVGEMSTAPEIPTVENPKGWNDGVVSREEWRQLKAGLCFIVSRLGGHVVAEFKETFPLLRE